MAQRPSVTRYFEGVRDAFGLAQRDPKINPGGASYQIGVYGNRVALDLCKAQGIVTWFWQSCSKLTAAGANQFRWPGVALHQVACEQPLCAGCGSKPCLAKVDWNESDGHEGSWLPLGAAVSAKSTQRELGSATDQEDETPKPKPLIMLTRLRLTWEKPGDVDFTEVGGRYRALFAQPLPDVGNTVVRLAGRILMLDAATGISRASTAADLRNLGATNAQAKARLGGRSGLASSTAHVATINHDGTFETETYLVSDGSSGFMAFDVSVDLARGAVLSTRLELERIDLENFLARVDAAEQRKPTGQTTLQFLASLRKIFQGGPSDPLGGLFDSVLFRFRKVPPLFQAGSLEHRELKRFQTLLAGGSLIDISHVLTGIEGSPAQKPDLGTRQHGLEPRLVVTWSGDLGSALAEYANRFARSLAADQVPDVQQELDARASRSDLLGDVDGINLGASYDPAKTVKQNLLAYYTQASGRRFHLFIDNSTKDGQGLPLVALRPGSRPPRLTASSRATIARHVREFAAPMVRLKYLNQLSGDQSTIVVSILEPDSLEMEIVVDHFVRFLEAGLAREH